MPWWMKYYTPRLQEAASGDNDGAGGGGQGDDAAAKAAAEAAAAAAAAGKPSDAEAKLIKEVMAKKELLKKQADDLAAAQAALKQFEGIDVEAVKQLMADQKAAAEKKLAEAGEWDRLRKQMADENERVVAGVRAENQTLQSTLQSTQAMIADLTVGASFSSSAFVREDLIIPASKVRALFGGHFEFKDGKVVGYDKPAGASERTPLVDATGESLSFEAALRKIVEADADRDGLLRSKAKPGAGSSGQQKQTPPDKRFEAVSGRDRIAAALAAQSK